MMSKDGVIYFIALNALMQEYDGQGQEATAWQRKFSLQAQTRGIQKIEYLTASNFEETSCRWRSWQTPRRAFATL